jgi:hypothetical protein
MKGFLLLFITIFLAALTTNAQLVDSVLNKAQQQLATETVYIQYNKEEYFLGDTIWCKAYIQTDGNSAFATSLKIQLLDTKGTPVAEELFPVFSGIAAGQVFIPKNISSGRYFIRAFTDIAVNKQDPSLAFVQPLLIRNQQQESAPSFISKPRLTAHWSSERQPVLTGISNELFFSITDQFYQPAVAEVYLVSNKNDTVCTATSSEYGIGKLIFTAIEGETYTALVYGKKDSLRYPVPTAKEGIDLSANPISNGYFVSINQTKNNLKKPAYLVGEMNFSNVLTQSLSGKKQQNITLATDSLPTGILRLLVLDAAYHTLAEKFVFVYHADSSAVFSSRNMSVTKTGDTSWLSNHVLPKTETNISVAATYENNNLFYPKQNIAARIWFTGYFKKPLPVVNSLFADPNAVLVHVCNTYLNVLDLHKPVWSQMLLATSAKDTMQKPAYLHFSGRMVDKNNNPVAIKKGTLNFILQTADSAKKYWSVPVAANGSFKEEGLVFTDSAKIFYQLTGDLDNDKRISLNSPATLTTEMRFANDDLSFLSDYPDLKTDTLIKETVIILSDSSKTEKPMASTNTLADVSVIAYKTLRQKTNELEKRYVKGVFDREASRRLDLINDPPLNKGMSVLDYFFLYSPGPYPKPIVYFLNEGQISRDELAYVTVNQVALIKFYKNFVMASGNDALVVYLKKSEDVPSIQHEGIGKSFFVLPGYSSARVSSTLFWNPEIISGINQAFRIALPQKNELQNGPLLITVEGVDADGLPIYYMKRITAW